MKEIEDLTVSQGISSAITGVRDGELAALLARVEKAEGPDRELDILLWSQLAEEREPIWDGNTLLGRSRRPPHDVCVLGFIDPGRVARNFTAGWSEPAYPDLTASLDAALALCELVLPGWQRIFGEHTMPGQRGVMWRGTLITPDGKSLYQGASKSPARALLAAMLKALIASGQDDTAERSTEPRETRK